MPHAKDSRLESTEMANREMSQVEFPDELADGILIWPSDRDFWVDEPIHFKFDLANREQAHYALKFEVFDLQGSLIDRLKGCELICRYRGEHLWHFEISFSQTIGDTAFVRDTLDALEKLQIEQTRLTEFAQAFGLIPATKKQMQSELGAHIFFP